MFVFVCNTDGIRFSREYVMYLSNSKKTPIVFACVRYILNTSMLAVHGNHGISRSHVAALAETDGARRCQQRRFQETYCNDGINLAKGSFRLMVQAMMLADTHQVKYDESTWQATNHRGSGLRCGEYHRCPNADARLLEDKYLSKSN
jgi:hypothetical protein